jgi:hypothetical protein
LFILGEVNKTDFFLNVRPEYNFVEIVNKINVFEMLNVQNKIYWTLSKLYKNIENANILINIRVTYNNIAQNMTLNFIYLRIDIQIAIC